MLVTSKTPKEIVEDKLYEAASCYYPMNTTHFKDFNHFIDSLKCIYGIIANATAEQMIKNIGDDYFCFSSFYKDFIKDMKPVNIGYKQFAKSLPRIYKDGKKRDVPYTPLLEALASYEIIFANPHYSANNFSKSYALHRTLMNELIECELRNKLVSEIDIFDTFQAFYPLKLLNRKKREAMKLYESLGEINGFRLILPQDWEKNISSMGKCNFDEKGRLTIDILLDNMKKIKNSSKPTIKKYGREYNWFTSCSSSFRNYIHIGGKNYRELIDCHSGFFWMFAIYGYQKGKIEKDECKKMISHCFKKTFYEDISGEKKTRFIKTNFMKILNMSSSQLNWLKRQFKYQHIILKIIQSLQSIYPQWYKYLELTRQEFKKELGIHNHETISQIEKSIMNKLKNELYKKGYNNLIRVHDALYGIDEINKDTIDDILYNIVLEYIEDISCNNNNSNKGVTEFISNMSPPQSENEIAA